MVPICQVDRIKKPELGGGGLHDLAIYTIQLATLVFNNEKPVKITADASLSDQGLHYMFINSLEQTDFLKYQIFVAVTMMNVCYSAITMITLLKKKY